MIDQELIKGGVIGVISVVIVITYLNTLGFASRNLEPTLAQNTYRLVYSRALKVLGVFWALATCIGVYALLQQGAKDDLEAIGFTAISLVLIVSGYAAVREVFTVSLSFDATSISKKSPFASFAGPLEWGEIEQVRYSTRYDSFELRGNGHLIRVSRYMAGLRTFLEMMNDKVPPSGLKKIRTELDILLRE